MNPLDLEAAVKGAGIIQLAQRLDKPFHHAGDGWFLVPCDGYSGASASSGICIVHDAHLPKWVQFNLIITCTLKACGN